MTARQVYEGVLIEMNKVLAPSLLLEDFNYLFNKAINQYINKRYNIYDVNQQTTDDIRVLKASAVLRPVKSFTSGVDGHNSNVYDDSLVNNGISGQNTSSPYGTVYDVTGMNSLYGATYEAYLPMDYLHLLSCICNFRVNKTFKCYDKGTFMQFAALRLTSDAWSTIINNFYMRPSYKRPYYYIHNVNTKRDVPTSPNRATGYYAGSDLKKLSDYTFTSGDVNCFVAAYPSILVNPSVVYDSNGNEVSALKTILTSGTGASKKITGITFTKIANDTDVPGSTISEAGVITLASGVGTHFKTYSGDLVTATAVKFGLNTSIYLKELEAIGVTNTGGDMDALNGGYTYGQYTNTESGEGPKGTSNFPRTVIIGREDGGSLAIDVVERPAAQRFGNASQVRLEIRYGKDDSLFELVSVYVDYIKVPQFIRLTQEQLDLTEDTSQIMEFPDYVCQEIINELVHIFMENSSDPRLQSHPVVSQSIANPTQGLAQPAAAS